MRTRTAFCCAVAVFKSLAVFYPEAAFAQGINGNLQSNVSSSVPKFGVQEVPRTVEEVVVSTVETIPGFTSEEAKSKQEKARDVIGVVHATQAKIRQSRSQRAPREGLVPEAAPNAPLALTVPPDELSLLVDNLLPQQPPHAERFAVQPDNRARAEDAVLSITEADVENAPEANLLKIMSAKGIPTKKTVVHRARQVVRTSKVKKERPPKTKLTAVLPFGDTFRSNALRSNGDRQEDWVFAASPTLLLVVPTGAKDSVLVSAGPTFQRFGRLGSSNRDIGNGTVRYTHLVDKPVGGPTSDQGFSLEATTLVVWDEGFTGHPVSFSGPLLTLFLNSVPLGSEKCGTKNPVPCYTVDFGATAAYTWSNLNVLDNGAIGASIGITRVIPEHDLTLAASLGLDGSVYPNEKKDRLDGGLTLAASVGWQMRPDTKLTAGVSYGYYRSTISDNDWDGYDLIPSIGLSMQLGEW